jgi:hypothetical protein
MMQENFVDAEVTGYRDLIPVMKNHQKELIESVAQSK